MDQISLHDIAVDCILGDLPQERIVAQRISVDLELSLTLEKAAQTDSLVDTVDYASLVKRIRDVLSQAHCRLLERAAALVVETVLADARVRRVKVRVSKFESVPGLSRASVVMERKNETDIES